MKGEPMKAKELITLLTKCDAEATVKFDDMSYPAAIDRSEVTAVYESRCIDGSGNFVILTNEGEDAND
jgi:hypothetical protein